MTSQKVLAWGAWISVFLLAWLIIFKIVIVTPAVWGFWIFFLLVAFFSSTFGYQPTSKRPPP